MRGRVLAIVALTLVSCSSRLVPASTPLPPAPPLRLVVTAPLADLASSLTTAYSRLNPGIQFDMIVESERGAAEIIRSDPHAYWLTSSLTAAGEAWAAPIGVDGIALIVHPGVGVRDLSLEQVRALFDGSARRWSAFGGADVTVTPFIREAGAGIRDAFTRQLMGAVDVDSGARIAPSDAAMHFAVSRTTGAIGYLSASAIAPGVTALRLDGVAPTRESIADQSYPLRTISYIVGAAEPPADDPVLRHYRAFIGWMQSAEGQAIIASHSAPLPVGQAMSAQSAPRS